MNSDTPEKALMDSRTTSSLTSGEKVHIEDITSSQIQIVDTQDKLLKVFEVMRSTGQNPDFGRHEDGKYEQMVTDCLMKWHGFTRKEKISKFSKFVSHELNFFIFKKDPEFFAGVVRFYI
mmetsp:Transcript_21121/g.32752  ORF Transcript_21121/g.32752 Transcript_21121/m.32752 type:complete len:120 (-) Transcript_21121:3367-3726(-)